MPDILLVLGGVCVRGVFMILQATLTCQHLLINNEDKIIFVMIRQDEDEKCRTRLHICLAYLNFKGKRNLFQIRISPWLPACQHNKL